MEIAQDLLLWKLSLTRTEEKYWRTVCEQTVEENIRCDGDKIIGIWDNYSVRIFTIRTIQQMSSQLKNKIPTWCHLLFYFTSYVLNIFRTLIYPSSGACDYSVELPHWLYCSWFDVCWSLGVVGLEWYPCCRLQNSRKLLMMDIFMSETCWAHKKWNKIASDIKLVFYSSTITMMHGPINIRFINVITFNGEWDGTEIYSRLFL